MLFRSPSLIKKIDVQERFKFNNIWYMILSMIIGFTMIAVENRISITSNTEFSFMYLVFAGACMSIGVVVPGISSTIILMILGVYSAYISSIAEVYLPIILPIGIGLSIGSLICMKIIKYLLYKYYIKTYYSIIGFSVGSAFVLYPGINFDLTGVISI